MNRIIVCLATPPAMGAIHVIRVSGHGVFEELGKICKTRITKQGFRIQRNRIVDPRTGKVVDDVLLMKFVAPRSYTGEDLIEINCHGSLAVAREITDLVLANCRGAQAAQPGEFTKTAFLNGKMSLNQAAAVDLFVKSQNQGARRLIVDSLLGASFPELEKIQQTVFRLIGTFEIGIDYPEYEEGLVDFRELRGQLDGIVARLQAVCDASERVLRTNDGVKIAIVGRPNAGKSSLLNALLDEDKAIVSSVPGTTRDVVEASARLDGFDIVFLDPAGIHAHRSQLEKQGIKKTRETIKKAHLVVCVLPADRKTNADERGLIAALRRQRKDHIVCFNKKDLVKSPDGERRDKIMVSAKNGQIGPLVDAIRSYLRDQSFSDHGQAVVASRWQLDCLKNAIGTLKEAKAAVAAAPYLDILVEPLKNVNEAILKILGKMIDYDLMDEIFKNFCLGK